MKINAATTKTKTQRMYTPIRDRGGTESLEQMEMAAVVKL